MTSIPIEGVVLQLKSMNIHNVVTFPFPTPPSPDALRRAEQLLVRLGALDSDARRITDLGRTMSQFPLAPRFSRMLILGRQGGCLPLAVALVATLTVGSPFVVIPDDSTDTETDVDRRGMQAFSPNGSVGSDILRQLRAVVAYDNAADPVQFCAAHALRPKAMQEIAQLRAQLAGIAATALGDESALANGRLSPPSREQEILLCQVLLCGFMDQVALRLPPDAKAPRGAYRTLSAEGYAFIHPSSVLSHAFPQFCVYTDIVQSAGSGGARRHLKGVTEVKPTWLARLGGAMCTYSEPLENPAPHYDEAKDAIMCVCEALYGAPLWRLPPTVMEHPPGKAKSAHFAKALLDGKIVAALKPFESKWSSKTTILLRPWSLAKAVDIVNVINNAGIASRKALLERWASEPGFLLAQVMAWTNDQAAQAALRLMWPPTK